MSRRFFCLLFLTLPVSFDDNISIARAVSTFLTHHTYLCYFLWWKLQVSQLRCGTKECAVTMETQSQASSTAEKKKRAETIVATKRSSLTRTEISEKAVASSTTSNGTESLIIISNDHLTCFKYNPNSKKVATLYKM